MTYGKMRVRNPDGGWIEVQCGGDAGGIVSETDPTVPAWAKQPNKPTYTADEVGAQPKGDYALKNEIPTVPTKVSAFTNDAGYLADVPDEYVTDKELEAKGYLTEHQDISGKLNVNQGSTNVGKILVVGADGNLTLADMPETMSGDVVGVIDENNNIVITGNLADGTYVFKYTNADGTYANIGSLTVGSGGTEITYTNLADTSADAGWLNDQRFSTSSLGEIKTCGGAVITNYIQVYRNQILRVKGIDFVNNHEVTDGVIIPVAMRYSEPGGNIVRELYLVSENGGTYDKTTNVSMINLGVQVGDGDYIRICGTLMDGYTADDVIITLDEEITD